MSRYSDAVLADGPAGYWRLDEAPGATEAANAVTGGAALVHGAGATPGEAGPTDQLGASVLYDNTIDGRSVGPAPALSHINITLECWAEIPEVATKGSFIKIGEANGWAIGIGGSSHDNVGFDFIALYENVRWIDTGVVITPGWHHFAITVDGAGACRSYIDGVLRHTSTGTAPKAPTGNVYVGCPTTAARSFGGRVDEAAVYPRVLSAAELAAHYEQGFLEHRPTTAFNDLILSDNPVGYWPLDREVPTSTVEFPLVGQEGTWQGTLPDVIPGAVHQPDPVDTAVLINGESWLRVPNPKVNFAAGTIEFWVEASPWVDHQGGFGIYQNHTTYANTNNHFAIWRHPSNIFYFRLLGNSTATQDLIADPSKLWVSPRAGWHHVVCTYGNGMMTVYIDGNIRGTRTANMPTTNPSGTVDIGRGYNYASNGHSLAHFAIYDYVLSLEQMRAHTIAGWNPATGPSPEPEPDPLWDGADAPMRF